jgi:hypothetical protein
VELLAHLDHDGRDLLWPVAVVAESPDDRSVVFRTYCNTWPVDGHHLLRAPILGPRHHRHGGIVGQYQLALVADDADGIVQIFLPDGYVREPLGPDALHRGADALRSYFLERFSGGGGIELEECEVTDDGMK